MAAYMVVFAKIHDRQKFLTDYGLPTAELIEKYEGRYLVRSPMVTALEGSLEEGTSAVISEWPNRAAVEAFWQSPEYEVLKAVRGPLADCQIVVIETPPATG